MRRAYGRLSMGDVSPHSTRRGSSRTSCVSTLIVSGYQKPTTALRIVKKGEQWTTDVVWENPAASLYMANAVVVGDKLFALSHRNRGQYMLLDLKTGKTLWTGMPRQAENAAIAHAGDLILSLEEDAELMVGRVSGPSFQELKRYKVADAATWAAPAISGKRIFVKDVSSVALFTLP